MHASIYIGHACVPTCRIFEDCGRMGRTPILYGQKEMKIAVAVCCFIAGAKVQLNYNCYNECINQCLLPSAAMIILHHHPRHYSGYCPWRESDCFRSHLVSG